MFFGHFKSNSVYDRKKNRRDDVSSGWLRQCDGVLLQKGGRASAVVAVSNVGSRGFRCVKLWSRLIRDEVLRADSKQ